MSYQINKKDALQMDLEDLERQIESELYSLQSFEQNLTNRSKCSNGNQQQMRQNSTKQLTKASIQNKKQGSSESRYSVGQNQKIQNTQSNVFDRQKNNYQVGCQNNKPLCKLMDPSNQLKEKNKNLFTIEDLNTEETKKTIRQRNKSPNESNISSSIHTKKNEIKNNKENQNPSTGFQSYKTINSSSSVRSNEKSILNKISQSKGSSQNKVISQKQGILQNKGTSSNNDKYNNQNQISSKQQQQRLQQQSQQIRQNIFDLIQNDKFDSGDSEQNNDYQNLDDEQQIQNQLFFEQNKFNNQQNQFSYQESQYGEQQYQNNQENNKNIININPIHYGERENFNYENLQKNDMAFSNNKQFQIIEFEENMNDFLAQNLIDSHRNQHRLKQDESGSTFRGKKSPINQSQELNRLTRSQSNLNCTSSRYSQIRSSKNSAISGTTTSRSYIDENCTFKPMLSKKSMELAEKMEDPRIRLTQSRIKQQEKVSKIRSSLESQYSYKPSINQNSKMNKQNFLQESVFNYSDEEDDYETQFNNYNEGLKSNKHSNRNHLKSSLSNGSDNVPRWQQLYEQHKVSQMEKEIKLIQKEKEEQEDPELTFQPKFIRLKDSNYMYSDNEYDISKRSQIWDQKRQEKIKKVAEQYENKDLEGCTFQPKTQSTIPGQNGQGTHSNNEFSQQITEFNKKGIIEYFERIDAAKKKRKEAEEQQNKINGQTWENKITIPHEFSFMKRSNHNQRSSQNLKDQSNERNQNNRSKSPSQVNHNKIMLFYKTRSISGNNLCSVEPKENQIYNDVSSSINNWDKVKENLHKHLHQFKI